MSGGRATGRPLNPRMVTGVFSRYATRAGLPPTIRLHDLRHTAITNAISQGEDILLIAAFAGHAKTSTTVDIYGHLMPDRVRQAAHRMRSISRAHIQTDPEPGLETPNLQAGFLRQLDATSPYATGPLGSGTSIPLAAERAAAPAEARPERARTDRVKPEST